MTPNLAPSGSLWLPVALSLSGFHWLSLSLSGSLWLPVTPTLALTATLWHTLALPGSLLLSNFAYTALDRLSLRALAQLSAPLPR